MKKIEAKFNAIVTVYIKKAWNLFTFFESVWFRLKNLIFFLDFYRYVVPSKCLKFYGK